MKVIEDIIEDEQEHREELSRLQERNQGATLEEFSCRRCHRVGQCHRL